MTPERRLKQFVIGPGEMSAALRGEGMAAPLPPGSEVVFGVWHADRQEFLLTIHNPAFDPVPRGGVVPLSLNGPIIQEA